jgi:hypothetical protein
MIRLTAKNRASRFHPEESPALYPSNTAMEDRWDALAASYGGHRETLGRSVLGRAIESWNWPSPNRPGRTVLLVSLLHPMEWVGRLAHLRLLESLLEDRALTGVRIVSVPTANPDGAARVEEARMRDRFRWVRGNARRVDLNRNFPVAHRTRPRLVDWWPMWNPGPLARSEPETDALCRLVEHESPALAISFHSFGRWIFYPPAARRRAARDAALLASAAEAARGIAPRYRVAQLGRWRFWFRAFGTEIDFFQSRGARAFLVETSAGGFGRWPWRRALHPFSIFNPPDAEPELERLTPALRRLVASALEA